MLIFKVLGQRAIWQFDVPFFFQNEQQHLDLGCGDKPRNPFKAKFIVGLDLNCTANSNPLTFGANVSSTTKIVQSDATLVLPFESNYFDSISAFDFLEHVPRWERRNNEVVFPFVDLMSEIHRVLKPGGYFLALTPGVPNLAAFSDPTHINFITTETVTYFASTSNRDCLARMYGFKGDFQVLHNSWLRGGGPNLDFSLHTDYSNSSGMKKIILTAKVIKRYSRALMHRNPTHIYWVLRKPLT